MSSSSSLQQQQPVIGGDNGPIKLRFIPVGQHTIIRSDTFISCNYVELFPKTTPTPIVRIHIKSVDYATTVDVPCDGKDQAAEIIYKLLEELSNCYN